MAASLAGQIKAAPGQPSSVRIGTITSVSPLTVSLQGQELNPEAVGVAGPITPVVGAAVALLGQSKTQGADPSSWLIVGMQAPSNLVSGPTYVMVDTDVAGFTNTGYLTGSPAICGIVFVAPASGAVRLDWHARFQTNTANTRSLVSAQVQTGSDFLAGTVVFPASDSRALENANDAAGGASTRMQASMYAMVSGLVAGDTYNAVTMHKMASAGNGDIYDRSLMVTPL